MAATYPFVFFFLWKDYTNDNFLVIHFGSKKFYEFGFRQILLFFYFKLVLLEFSFFDLYMENIFTKLFQLIDWH